MDLSKLTYSKGEAEKEAKEPSQEATATKRVDQEAIRVGEIPLSYQKTEGILSSSLVFVLSGGEKREKDFLYELIRQKELHSLRIAFLSEKGQGLQPYQMQDVWSKVLSTGKVLIDDQEYYLDKTDKVFLLSDVDEFYDQLKKIFNDSSDKSSCQWIISNPCFEMWLYYCYKNDPENDLAVLISEPAKTRSKKLKSLGQKLVTGGLNPRRAFEYMEKGVAHSQIYYKVDKIGIPELFATQMHLMAQYLMDKMNENENEYIEFIRQRNERREQMRSLKNNRI